MIIHEYQAKQLLAQHGVPVPKGSVATTARAARAIADQLFAAGYSRVVVKAQIHAGGRGKGTFKSGLHGGVRACASADEVGACAEAMLGQTLVTRQTGRAGRVVKKLLIEAGASIMREFYCAALVDRSAGCPLLVVGNEGGVDIEEVGAAAPDKIMKELIDPAVGLMPFQARKLGAALGLGSDLISGLGRVLLGVYQTWWGSDASLVEINPLGLVEGLDGSISFLALDAKIALDDNGLFRHPEIEEMRDLSEESSLETEARGHNLSYVKLDGNIACLVNGAGLAMATMDIIKQYGGEAANFLDVGGGASVEQVTAAFEVIMKDPGVKAILVNIFGGIVDCDVIAQGIVAAAKQFGLKLPLVVRLEGNNAQKGRQTLAHSGLTIASSDTMADAAERVVKAAG